jgi:hypothetical protein
MNKSETWKKRKDVKAVGLTSAPMHRRPIGDPTLNTSRTLMQTEDRACRVCGYVVCAPTCGNTTKLVSKLEARGEELRQRLLQGQWRIPEQLLPPPETDMEDALRAAQQRSRLVEVDRGSWIRLAWRSK